MLFLSAVWYKIFYRTQSNYRLMALIFSSIFRMAIHVNDMMQIRVLIRPTVVKVIQRWLWTTSLQNALWNNSGTKILCYVNALIYLINISNSTSEQLANGTIPRTPTTTKISHGNDSCFSVSITQEKVKMCVHFQFKF